MATDITETNWEYPHKCTDLEIVGLEGLVKALIDIHGPNFHGSLYNARFNNIRTEWVTAGSRRVRCGVRLAVVSGGCGTHPNSKDNSMNLLVKNLKEGKITSIKWGQINDPKKGLDTSKDPAQLAKQENEAILVQQDAEVAAMDNKGQFDPRNYSVYNAFNERKLQREREEDEQRRVEAAERKSRITGKSTKKKKVADEDGVPPLPDIPRKGFGKSILKFGKRSNKPDASKWAGKPGGANA